MSENSYEICGNSLAILEWSLKWQSPAARHQERFLARRVNIWRDVFPLGMERELTGACINDTVSRDYAPGEAVPPYDQRKVRTIPSREFKVIRVAGRDILPREGRFYPLNTLAGVVGMPQASALPYRLLENNGTTMLADLNHPLARYPLRFSATVLNAAEKDTDTGGRLSAWMEEVADSGPGMQSPWNGKGTDYCGGRIMERLDTDDAGFYAQPRMVPHIDSQARELLEQEYSARIPEKGRTLDLMSSFQSHLTLRPGLEITGLGMNKEELEANPALSKRLVQDLNANPKLLFQDNWFDAVVCSLSVEYLSAPVEVFQEVKRVLRPGGVFLLSFSNRWFPTKVALCWPDLHPFERMGLVLSWLEESGFNDRETVSIRNWWRPFDDPYFRRIKASDPLFLVQGAKS